jgi:hypothetical protein
MQRQIRPTKRKKTTVGRSVDGVEIYFSAGERNMKKTIMISLCTILAIVAAGAAITTRRTGATAKVTQSPDYRRPIPYQEGFEMQVLVNGYPLEEYYLKGRSYVQAIEGAEYEVRLRNPLPYRVAVALSVDGLNSIDARRTSAWNASKWVVGPYETIHISGWQMSSSRARRFYFTTERDSYAAKLGQTANFGVVSAVFFREMRQRPMTIILPPRPLYEDGDRKSQAPPPARSESQAEGRAKKDATTQSDDEYAATGIGRSVQNDVRWVSMDLDSRPAAELMLRYEYYPALVRLGVLPRPPYNYRPDPLRRREGATGFEDRRFSPEP